MKIIQKFTTNNPCYYGDGYIVPRGLMLHSVGSPQPSGEVWSNRFNGNVGACVHAFIDANNGTIYQTLPWNHRGWHCAGSGNDTHIGVEMAESQYISYTSGANFTCFNLTAARKQAQTAYNAAVELFAYLCKQYKLDPLTQICSHAEGYRKGIASNHADPEHYWNQLGTGYTMDGFRKAVKAKMGTSTAVQQPVVSTKIYRVRKSPTDSKTQLGAFTVLHNAKELADKNPGYAVYDMNETLIYKPANSNKKTVSEIAEEVIEGKWGNGSDRWARLVNAGYDYNEVQAEVNRLLRG